VHPAVVPILNKLLTGKWSTARASLPPMPATSKDGAIELDGDDDLTVHQRAKSFFPCWADREGDPDIAPAAATFSIRSIADASARARRSPG
jgi:hypothetical protein